MSKANGSEALVAEQLSKIAPSSSYADDRSSTIS